MTVAQLTAADLRGVDLFDDLDDEQLEGWRAAGTPSQLAAGTVLVEQGAPSPGFHLVLEGSVRAPSSSCRPAAASPSATSRSSKAVSLSRPTLTGSGGNSRAKVQSITVRSFRPQPGICSR